MKKFLIFLVAIITTVSIGVTFYQFAKNDEIIKVNTDTVYINYGEKLSLDDLGFSHKEVNKQTEINFNAGGEEVTSIIKYDELSKCFVPTSKGGATTIKITTTNRKYKSFNINVIVGIGTEENPYYITTEQQLFDVTNKHINDNACFQLVNDINITNVHAPIGLTEDGCREFTGTFDGNYKTISNLKIASCDNGGLFASLSTNSLVCNLNVKNAVIDGEFNNVGTIAGICYGTINKVIVHNSAINNTRANSNTGAVVGNLKTDDTNKITASILRTTAYSDNNIKIVANGNVGGLAGCVDSAIIHACHSDVVLENNSNGTTGGLIGTLVVDPYTYVRESYSLSNISGKGACGNIAGLISINPNSKFADITKELVLVGLYYDKTLNNFSGAGHDTYNFMSASSFAVNGKTTEELKTKNTYVYYINNSNDIIYWDNVWYLADGAFPTLVFTATFDDIILEGGTQLPTNPDTDLSNPESPNTSSIIISNKTELINAFQNPSKTVSGNYILSDNIDLEGYDWIPVSFTGSFKSSGNNNFSISNFTIVGDNLKYVGFFTNLGTATVANINFNNVKLISNTDIESAGIVVGHIRGNVVVKNINITEAKITADAKYIGGVAGYISNLITKIEKCNIQNLTVENTGANVGGVVGYSSNDTYIISCKLKNYNLLKGVDRVGGITSVNHGTIYDCSFSGTIQSIDVSNVGYFGGLAGINYSNISNCSAFAEISITNNSSTSNYYVGGLVGYNVGNILNSSVYANKFSTNESSSVVYIAGLTGFNSGIIEYCVADVKEIGSVHNKIYTAGLSVFNYGGTISGSFAFGNLYGYQVAGLVRINTNNGTIDSCMAGLNKLIDNKNASDELVNKSFARATYKGHQIASFVYEISTGTISNCLVNADLNCTNDKGWIAGFAGFMPYASKKFGTISNSIANVSFSGIGSKYLEIAQDGLMKKTRTTGTITNCVISQDANVEDVIISKYSYSVGKVVEPGSKSNYIIVSAEEMTQMEVFVNPTTCNFDVFAGLIDSKWLFVDSCKLILPRSYVVVFGYDIIGLN